MPKHIKIGEMQQVLKKVWIALLSPLGKDCGEIEYVGEEEGYWIESLNMGLEPIEMEQMVPGWQPTRATVNYHYPDAPDEIDICKIGEPFTHLECAFAFVIGEWVKNQVENELLADISTTELHNAVMWEESRSRHREYWISKISE